MSASSFLSQSAPSRSLRSGNLLPRPSAPRLRLTHGLQQRIVDRWRHGAAVPNDAVDAPFGAATAGGKIQPAIWSDGQVGHIQRPALHEDFARSFVTAAGRLQMHRQNPSLRPIAHEQRVVILGWIHVMIVNFHAGRRTAIGIERGRQAVEIVIGPGRPTAAPAEFVPGNKLRDARGPVPGKPQIPFHIGVAGEQIAAFVERKVISIAQPAGIELHEAAVGVGANDHSAGSLGAGNLAAGVFILRLRQISFVGTPVRALRSRMPF